MPNSDDHQQRAPQSQFFGGHGEDEVGVRLGQIEELLLAFHQAQPGEAAGADRDHRLDDVEAFALRVFERIEESLHARPAPRYAHDQEVQRHAAKRPARTRDTACSSRRRNSTAAEMAMQAMAVPRSGSFTISKAKQQRGSGGGEQHMSSSR